MDMYGFADNVTWAAIWNGVKNEIKDTHKDIKYGSEEFWELCNERASEVFDKTQVVDSVFHRSDVMRNPDGLSKLMTSFMAEPTKTYNMIYNSVISAHRKWLDGDTSEASRIITKTLTVFALNAVAVSAASAVVDVMRGKNKEDDDDFYEAFMKNFLSNLTDNANPLSMIVGVKDVWGIIDQRLLNHRFSSTTSLNLVFDGWEKFVQGLADFEKVKSGKMDALDWITGDITAGFGTLTGLPLRTIFRDGKILLKAVGVTSFAGDGSGELELDTSKPGVLDYENQWFDIKDGSTLDKFLNKLGFNLTKEEREERVFNRQISELQNKTKGMSGDEKAKTINDAVMKGYSKYIEAGSYGEIYQMRNLIEKAGGDVAAFDEKVEKKTATEFKKTIGTEGSEKKQRIMRDYLLAHGWSEYKISRELTYKSNAAKDFKAACRELNVDKAIDTLTPLIEAGITEEDVYRLYENRNRGNFDTYSKGTLVSPTEGGTITSAFGYRNAPTAGASSYHEGIDIGLPTGSPVRAADGGVVIFAGQSGGYGNHIIIQHDNGVKTYYSHLNNIDVKYGQHVSQNQYIGGVGSTGVSTGPHLDFRVNVNGQYVDPLSYVKY